MAAIETQLRETGNEQDVAAFNRLMREGIAQEEVKMSAKLYVVGVLHKIAMSRGESFDTFIQGLKDSGDLEQAIRDAIIQNAKGTIPLVGADAVTFLQEKLRDIEEVLARLQGMPQNKKALSEVYFLIKDPDTGEVIETYEDIISGAQSELAETLEDLNILYQKLNSQNYTYEDILLSAAEIEEARQYYLHDDGEFERTNGRKERMGRIERLEKGVDFWNTQVALSSGDQAWNDFAVAMRDLQEALRLNAHASWQRAKDDQMAYDAVEKMAMEKYGQTIEQLAQASVTNALAIHNLTVADAQGYGLNDVFSQWGLSVFLTEYNHTAADLNQVGLVALLAQHNLVVADLLKYGKVGVIREYKLNGAMETPQQILGKKIALITEFRTLLQQTIDLVDASKDILVTDYNQFPFIPLARKPGDDPTKVRTIAESRTYWTQDDGEPGAQSKMGRLDRIDESISYLTDVKLAGLVNDQVMLLIDRLIASLEAEKQYYHDHAKDEIDKDEAFLLAIEKGEQPTESMDDVRTRKIAARIAEQTLYQERLSYYEAFDGIGANFWKDGFRENAQMILDWERDQALQALDTYMSMSGFGENNPTNVIAHGGGLTNALESKLDARTSTQVRQLKASKDILERQFLATGENVWLRIEHLMNKLFNYVKIFLPRLKKATPLNQMHIT